MSEVHEGHGGHGGHEGQVGAWNGFDSDAETEFGDEADNIRGLDRKDRRAFGSENLRDQHGGPCSLDGTLPSRSFRSDTMQGPVTHA